MSTSDDLCGCLVDIRRYTMYNLIVRLLYLLGGVVFGNVSYLLRISLTGVHIVQNTLIFILINKYDLYVKK
jgi:hypothetical protein